MVSLTINVSSVSPVVLTNKAPPSVSALHEENDDLCADVPSIRSRPFDPSEA